LDEAGLKFIVGSRVTKAPDLHKVKEISGFWLMFALVAGLQVVDLGH